MKVVGFTLQNPLASDEQSTMRDPIDSYSSQLMKGDTMIEWKRKQKLSQSTWEVGEW